LQLPSLLGITFKIYIIINIYAVLYVLLFCKKENVKNARIMVYNKVNYGEDAGKNGNENAYVTRDM